MTKDKKSLSKKELDDRTSAIAKSNIPIQEKVNWIIEHWGCDEMVARNMLRVFSGKPMVENGIIYD